MVITPGEPQVFYPGRLGLVHLQALIVRGHIILKGEFDTVMADQKLVHP
jgi:hypothetical protein